MASDLVRLERHAAAALITIDRPEARNALTAGMRRTLVTLLSELRDDRGLRVVVLRGAGGKSFVSGGDIREFEEQPSVDAFLAMAREAEQMFRAIEQLPVPVVAVIEGYALGGGLTLAVACDLRLCTSDARLGIPSARSLGNCISPGEYGRLAALIGPGRAKEMLIRASMLSAETALAWGLVNEIVERDALEGRVAALVEELSAHAPLSMWAAKESIRRLTPGFETGEDVMERVLGSEDFREGIASFVEKRPPRWRNQ